MREEGATTSLAAEPARRLFADPQGQRQPDPDGTLKLLSGPDPEREIREVARHVPRLGA